MSNQKQKLIDKICKFKIGDFVCHRGFRLKEVDELPFKFDDSSKNVARMMILERFIQECHGGVQIFYDCRLCFPNGGIGMRDSSIDSRWRFTEIELEPSEPVTIEIEKPKKDTVVRRLKRERIKTGNIRKS